MGLFGKIFGEFVDVIDWTDDSNDIMVYRFERYGNEIKYGAKLTVRESQVAVFVNEGEAADVLSPGIYELETKNLPILTTLQHWDHGFNSPFKAEVYFCHTKRFVDLKWGTKNPLMLRDSEFGAVRLRAFGSYAVRITDALKFIREIVGTDGQFTTDEISNQLRNLITARFATVVASSNIPILDMAANYDQLGDFITQRIAPEFEEYGLELTKMLVENISLPPAVEEALDKKTSIGMIGNLDQYLKYQSGAAMESAANNPSGGAAEGIGMGVGFAMANQMAKGLAPGMVSGQSSSAMPPPLPADTQYHIALDGETTGPFSMNEVRARIIGGDVNSETLVWAMGMVEWKPAGQVAVFRSQFSPGQPPPLPSS